MYAHHIHTRTHIYIYIYICGEREKERCVDAFSPLACMHFLSVHFYGFTFSG